MGEERRVRPVPTAAELAANRAEALALTNVSRETSARLDRLVDIFLDCQRHTNLVAASTLPQLWTRHIADSLQLLRLAPSAKIWVDLGSGGGFPGLVLACVLADWPDAHVHLVESIHKKCDFLREAAVALALPASVHCTRIEEFAEKFTGHIDVVTARAVAPLDRLLTFAAPLLKTGTLGIFPKGQDVGVELTEASKCWKIDAVIEPSLTSYASGIVVVRSISDNQQSRARRSPDARKTSRHV